ncbi:MAG: SAM-dependent methyltransferase, partial [Nitrosopumilales archaeon CG11_big_fil_rev_8_21_14_0_20_33_24]
MKTTLTEHLVCPMCRKNFTLKITKKSKEEIVEGYLICANKHRFKIT